MPETSDQRPSATVPLSNELRAALLPVLGRHERVDSIAAGVGCTLVLTDQRLILVRDGAHFRPRTGVRAWDIDHRMRLHLTPTQHATSRLVIDVDSHSTSIFVTGDQQASVMVIVTAIRRRIHSRSDDTLPGADDRSVQPV